jgi:hypothetical protein
LITGSLSFPGTSWSNTSSLSNQRLGWLDSWTPTRTAFPGLELDLHELPLDSWTASHCSLEPFFLFCLWSVGSGVWPTVSSRRPYRNQRSSLLKCVCWLVASRKRICNEFRIIARGDLPWKRAYIWLLRNTSQCVRIKVLTEITITGTLRRVALVRTDVSKERSASIIRMTRIDELGTTLTVTSNRNTLRRNTKWIST